MDSYISIFNFSMLELKLAVSVRELEGKVEELEERNRGLEKEVIDLSQRNNHLDSLIEDYNREAEKNVSTAVVSTDEFVAWGMEAQKIKVIKAVRAITGLGLKEANDLVNSRWRKGFYLKDPPPERVEIMVQRW